MLDYNPKDATICWPAADYDAELLKVDQATSKAGNPMEKWTCRIFAPDGREQILSDYVVVPSGVFKIKQLATAVNRAEMFEAGTFQAEDHIGSAFKVALDIEKSDEFPDKNKIKKYKAAASDRSAERSPAPSQSRRPQSAAVGAPFGDEQTVPPEDIPFRWEPLSRWV